MFRSRFPRVLLSKHPFEAHPSGAVAQDGAEPQLREFCIFGVASWGEIIKSSPARCRSCHAHLQPSMTSTPLPHGPSLLQYCDRFIHFGGSVVCGGIAVFDQSR
jgi:hypothetical protein